jgi:hypothetical protein
LCTYTSICNFLVCACVMLVLTQTLKLVWTHATAKCMPSRTNETDRLNIVGAYSLQNHALRAYTTGMCLGTQWFAGTSSRWRSRAWTRKIRLYIRSFSVPLRQTSVRSDCTSEFCKHQYLLCSSVCGQLESVGPGGAGPDRRPCGVGCCWVYLCGLEKHRVYGVQVKLTGLRVTLDYFTSILILSEGCIDGEGKVDIETMDSRRARHRLPWPL